MNESDSWQLARAKSVQVNADDILVFLDGGSTVRAPLTWFPELNSAPRSALQSCRVIDSGEFVSWEPYVDERLSIPYLALAAMTLAGGSSH
jgi:hypothetical protein